MRGGGRVGGAVSVLISGSHLCLVPGSLSFLVSYRKDLEASLWVVTVPEDAKGPPSLKDTSLHFYTSVPSTCPEVISFPFFFFGRPMAYGISRLGIRSELHLQPTLQLQYQIL